MGYLVTARKWRPQRFSEIVGQEALVRSLKNAIISNKIPHALLFSGIRGVGKTTTARIFAKAINCQNLTPDGEPCNECASCTEITNGYSMNVVEIDGASNRGIDNIRDLKEGTIYAPTSGKYRVYIIDEVHMLTNEASNALLKTLEEPPSHVVFILATTEVHKVLSTIRSRCQNYFFKRIPNHVIVEQLTKISEAEGVKYTDEALFLIAENSEGSMRDAESLFDQICLYSDKNITEETVRELLGIPEEEYFEKLIFSAVKKDYLKALNVLDDYLNIYGDLKVFLKHWILYLKNGLLVKKIEFEKDLFSFSKKKYDHLKEVFSAFSEDEIIRIIDVFTELFKEMKSEVGDRFLFEIALFKFIDYKNLIKISEIREEILKVLELDSSKKLKQEAPKVITSTSSSEMPKTGIVKNEQKHPVVEKTEENIKKVFYDLFSKSPIHKPMLANLNFLKFENDHIFLEIKTPHVMEYFTKNKTIIENKLSSICGFKINLVLKIRKEENVSNPELEIFRKNGEMNKETKRNQATVEEMIKELFNGEIIQQ